MDESVKDLCQLVGNFREDACFDIWIGNKVINLINCIAFQEIFSSDPGFFSCFFSLFDCSQLSNFVYIVILFCSQLELNNLFQILNNGSRLYLAQLNFTQLYMSSLELFTQACRCLDNQLVILKQSHKQLLFGITLIFRYIIFI